MVECTGLENRRTLIAFPGFESLVSRQDLHESLAIAGLLRFWRSGMLIVKHLIVSASFLAVSATQPDLRSASRLHDLANASIDRLRDAFVRVPQEAAGITQVEDLAGGFRSDIAELELTNARSKNPISFLAGCRYRPVPGVVKAQSQHRLGHLSPILRDNQVRAPHAAGTPLLYQPLH